MRWDGRAKTLLSEELARWQSEGRVVPVCPETLGGLPTPRPPAEIASGADGGDVLAGSVRVTTRNGEDVTDAFVQGAEATLARAREAGAQLALLIDLSPSCGSLAIYDGSFSGARHPGAGVTAALLRQNGVRVFAPSQIDALAAAMDGD